MIEAGTSVDGYRVERMIGRGGMGVVYEAVQLSMRRRVALKVLRPELADDPAFAERFRREAQLQASLEHPNVLEVYDVGESDGGLYLAMRLVSGRTLLDVLREGELDAERALRLLDQVTGALDSAHEAALIHRDVKPQNVLVDDGDRAFLADFGLTRAGTQTTVASSSPMLGSVAYVAPEIVRGEEPTPASDRYSVAATVFHCITGDVVFPRASDAAVLYAHATEPPPRARERRGELPEAIDEVLGPALAKDPGSRPPTAQAIVGGVRDALGTGVGRLGSPRGPAPVPTAPADPYRPRPVKARARPASRWPALPCSRPRRSGPASRCSSTETTPPKPQRPKGTWWRCRPSHPVPCRWAARWERRIDRSTASDARRGPGRPAVRSCRRSSPMGPCWSLRTA
jgi:serine/threonine-protein kinase